MKADDLDARVVVQAEEILDKIEKGVPVNYTNVVIEGDLDLSKLDLPTEHVERTEFEIERGLSETVKVVTSSIKITNSEINGNVSFGNAIFQQPIDFSETIFGGDADFLDAKFSGSYASFGYAKFSGNANFSGAQFSGGDANFGYAEFSGDTYFGGAQFSGSAYFREAQFSGNADFHGAQFSRGANFGYAQFSGGSASFREAQFSGDADFREAQFSPSADFVGTQFSGSAYFMEAQFSGGDADFLDAKFSGEVLTFNGAVFDNPESQEYACRRAKKILESQGDKEEADYHFYREMDGKRRQKLPLIRYPEKLFIQWIFGYGVRPFRLAGFWLLAVFLLAVAYWHGLGVHRVIDNSNVTLLREYVYFSIVTAATPGYGGYSPQGIYQWIAGGQAIFGTFMWAAFITTFARKFMR